MRKKIMTWTGSIILLLAGLTYLIWNHYCNAGEIATLSVSSDGRYVVSGDTKKMIVLWDIQTHHKTIISRTGNMFSTYWIKNTPNFIWQDINTKIVYVQNINGQTLKTIPLTFIVFGQAMSSDLNYYVASSQNWNIYLYHNNTLERMVKNYDEMDFDAANKLINFTFLGNDKLLTSGLGSANADDPKYATGIFLWDLVNKKNIRDFMGNESQTFATLSPDGKYVVSGDVNASQFVWDRKTGKLLVEVSGNEPVLSHNKDGSVTTDKNILQAPADYVGEDGDPSVNIFAVKFIDDTHYLHFTTRVPYAILFQTTDPKPLQYFSLGRHPFPAVNDYQRDQAIDTSPSAHILVMGKENSGGILVYRYDPDKQTLTKVWNGR